jgi:hypothetical protein
MKKHTIGVRKWVIVSTLGLICTFELAATMFPNALKLSGGRTLHFEHVRSWGFYSDKTFACGVDANGNGAGITVESATYGPISISRSY